MGYIQCSPVVEEEEESSRPCVECEVPRELLPHRDQLMPPLDIGFERFEENIWKIYSSNLSKPMSRGGINWSLCGSNSLGTSHSTQVRDDSSSSSIAGLHCMYCYLVYIGVMSVRTSR